MTVARLWKTSVVEGRTSEYESFARQVSVPMFKLQEGFCGVIMMRSGQDCSVLTFWHDQHAVHQLDASESYAATVKAILSAGFLCGPQSVAISEVHEAAIEPPLRVTT